jgi:hypothetical protein
MTTSSRIEVALSLRRLIEMSQQRPAPSQELGAPPAWLLIAGVVSVVIVAVTIRIDSRDRSGAASSRLARRLLEPPAAIASASWSSWPGARVVSASSGGASSQLRSPWRALTIVLLEIS